MIPMDRLIRPFIPTTAMLSYNPVFRVLGDVLSEIPSLLYPEFRGLPPNHLRVRVGVGNKLLFNQVYHLRVGAGFWLSWLSSCYVKANSDILEIGCGCGRIAHHLRGDWFAGSYVGRLISTRSRCNGALQIFHPKDLNSFRRPTQAPPTRAIRLSKAPQSHFRRFGKRISSIPLPFTPTCLKMKSSTIPVNPLRCFVQTVRST